MLIITNILAGRFIGAVADVLYAVLTIYFYIIIARALISWVNPDPYNPVVNFLYRLTEPVLSRFRRLLPVMGGLDLSPLLVLLIIHFIRKFLVASLYDLQLYLGPH